MNNLSDAMTFYFFVSIFSLLQRGWLALICVHATYRPGACRDQKMPPNLQKLES